MLLFFFSWHFALFSMAVFFRSIHSTCLRAITMCIRARAAATMRKIPNIETSCISNDPLLFRCTFLRFSLCVTYQIFIVTFCENVPWTKREASWSLENKRDTCMVLFFVTFWMKMKPKLIRLKTLLFSCGGVFQHATNFNRVVFFSLLWLFVYSTKKQPM